MTGMTGGGMIIQTSRFGQVEFHSDGVLHFPEGILGFSNLKQFILVDDPSDEVFAWLQSCDESSIAFPVLEPELFTEAYHVSLSKSDLEALKLQSDGAFRLFAIVTIPDDPTKMTANLKAPIVVNIAQKLARQCVLQDNSLAIREPIFHKLQQRVMTRPNQPIKRQGSEIEVVVGRPRGLPESIL